MKVGQRYNPYMMFTGIFIPNNIAERKDLTLCDKMVFGRLSQYAGKNGECYPKQTQIADEIGSSISAVKASIKHLVEFGLIEVVKPIGSDILKHMHDKYFFIWSNIFEDSQTVEKKLSGGLDSDCRNKENNIKEIIKPIKPSLSGTDSKIPRKSFKIFNKVKLSPSTRAESIADYFFTEFESVNGEHPSVADEQMTRGLSVIQEYMVDSDFEDERICKIVKYFLSSPALRDSGSDSNWNLFTDKRVMEARCRERGE